MIDDILSLPEVATIDGKEYKIEYTCKAYGILEAMTGKSTFKIRNLMLDGELGIIDSIEVICAGLNKNHTDEEVKNVRKYVENNLHIISEINMEVVKAFIKPLMPPEVYNKLIEAKKEVHKILEAGDEIKKKTRKKVS